MQAKSFRGDVSSDENRFRAGTGCVTRDIREKLFLLATVQIIAMFTNRNLAAIAQTGDVIMMR